MNENGPAQTEPRCTNCGGELAQEDRTLERRLVGLLLILAALALWVSNSAAGAQLGYAGATAAAMLGLVLMARRSCWRCVSCGARFRCKAPPRALAQSAGAQDQDADSSDVSCGAP